MSIEPTSGLLEPEEFDYIVVVGGLLHGSTAPIDHVATNYLRRVGASSANLVGLCTGSFILCRLGLMQRRKVCVSWYHNQDFKAEFPGLEPVADRLFVVDRNRITCSGGTGVADVAAWLVKKHIGTAVAQKALHILLIERARPETSTQPAPPLASESPDERIRRTLLRMEQNLSVPLRITRIAADLGMSERNLERLFQQRLGITPRQSYMALRLRHANWLLEHSNMTLPAIAGELGFADASHLGRCYKSAFGLRPGEVRRGLQPGLLASKRQRLECAQPPRVFENAERRGSSRGAKTGIRP